MGKQTTGNYRGMCESTSGKVTKNGEPKHSGNFSYDAFRRQNLKTRDYFVYLRKTEDGEPILIVGDHTPLAKLMGACVAELALIDTSFSMYRQDGEHTYGCKKYEAHKILTKSKADMTWVIDPYEFVYREEIYTDGEFEYQFIEY